MKILRYFIAIIIIGYIEIKYNMNLQGYSIVLICIIGTVYSCEFDYSKIVNVFNDIQGKMDYMHGSFLDLLKNGGIFFGVMAAVILTCVLGYKCWKQQRNNNKPQTEPEVGELLRQILAKVNE